MSVTIENSIPNNMLDATNVGRVLISKAAIKETPEMVRSIMAQMIPVHTSYDRSTEIFDYVAVSDHFDELTTQDIIPVYTTQIHSDGSVAFLRTTYKRVVPDSVKDEIMRTIMENAVNLADFKEFVLRYDNASEKDFTTYNEDFLEALLIYIDRTRDANE